MIKKALIAMSGGVDSTVAASLALEKGYQCTGVTLDLFGGSPCVNDAKTAALDLGIEHCVLNCVKEFENSVIRHFIESYENGLTPNPCIECNRRIKFNINLFQKLMPDKARTDFDFIITGHYARITQDSVSGRFLLQKALDEKKDQSYVLYSLTQKQLEKACFPLGGLLKEDVRRIAKEKKLTAAVKKESQDICFVPHGDYGRFIEEYTGKTYPQGDILDTEGKVIGKHKGIIRCTIGQRRGLGVAANIPIYVVKKSAEDNTVILGPDSALYSKSLIAKNINLIACSDLKKQIRVMVKTRYLQTPSSAVAEQTEDDTLRIDFDEPQRAISPGQAAVMYDGNTVVGGGTIV